MSLFHEGVLVGSVCGDEGGDTFGCGFWTPSGGMGWCTRHVRLVIPVRLFVHQCALTAERSVIYGWLALCPRVFVRYIPDPNPIQDRTGCFATSEGNAEERQGAMFGRPG